MYQSIYLFFKASVADPSLSEENIKSQIEVRVLVGGVTCL